MEPKKKGMTLVAKQKAAGWAFLIPASAMIVNYVAFPMVKAFILSLQTGKGANMHLSGFSNYVRMFQDKVFLRSVGNTFIYLAIQVPIMLVLAILLAQLLNNRDLKLRGFFRTCVFLPCATSLGFLRFDLPFPVRTGRICKQCISRFRHLGSGI